MNNSKNNISDRYNNSLFYNLLIRPFYYGYLRFREYSSPADVNLISLGVFVAACLAITATFIFNTPLDVTEEHRNLFNIKDSATQKYFYILLAGIVFIGAFFQGAWKKEISYRFVEKIHNASPLIFKTIVSAILLYVSISLLSHYLDILLDKRAFFATLIVLVIFTLFVTFYETFKGTLLLFLFFGILFVGFFILPLGWTYEIGNPSLWALDHHWSGVIGYSFLQANSPTLKTDLFPQYGIYLNLITAFLFKFPVFSGFGGAVSLIQVTNILFAFLLLGILIQRFGKENSKLALLAFSLIILAFAPYFSASATTVPVPNQAPIRFFFIPITILLSFHLAKRPFFVAWCMAGLLNMVALGYNFESGIACTLGLGYALFLNTYRQGVLKLFFGALIYFISASICFYLLFEIIPNHTTSFPKLDFSTGAELLALFSGGYGGSKFFWYLPIFVIMGHCLYLFSEGLRGIKKEGQLSSVELQTHTIVGIIIAFFPYIANRFFITNMWLTILLYLLISLPVLRSLKLPKQLLLLSSVILILLPFQLKETSNFIKQAKYSWESSSENACFLGITAPENVCSYVANQAKELEEKASGNNKLAWLSATPLTVTSLSGVTPSFSDLDLFSAARTKQTHKKMLDKIRVLDPDIIMIDRLDHLNPTGIPIQVSNWQKRLVKELDYKITDQSDYWIYASKVSN